VLRRSHRDQRGQSLVIVLSLVTILFLLGSALAVHASVALRATNSTKSQGNDSYAADAAVELGIWWQRNGKAGNPPAQTINGITTSTTITTAGGGGGGSCPADATPDWMSGMESGLLIRWTNTFTPNTIPRPSDGQPPAGGWFDKQGDTAVVTTPVRTGNYALKVHNTPGSGGGAYAATRFATPYPTYAVMRFSTWFDTLPSINTPVTLIATTGGTSANQFIIYYDASTHKWVAGWGYNGSYGITQQGTVTATTGAWFSFDIRISANNQNPRTADWYVNGIAQTSVSATDTANATNVSTWYIGYWPFPSISADTTVFFDDIVLSRNPADFPLGDIKVAPLVPNVMGTHNTPANFQNNDGTAINSTSYTRVDEIPNDQNATTDYIKQTATSATSYIEMGFPDTTETCIRGASVVAGLRAVGTSANVAAIHSVANGFDYTQFSGDTSYTTPIWYTANMVSQNATTPGTGPWTQAVINGLTVRFGYSPSATNRLPYLDSLLVEYGYRPLGGGGPATVTIVGTGGGSTTTTTYPDAGAGVPTLSTWTTTK
jgi:hypothetical protein